LTFFVIIVLPLFGFIGLVTNEAFKVAEQAKPWVQEQIEDRDELQDRLRQLPGFQYAAPYSKQIMSRIGGAVSGLGNFIFARASAITAGTLMFFVYFAIMLYAMFFFLRDGPAVIDKILYYLPLDSKDEKKLLNGFRSMARATIKSLVVIGLAQGALAGLALWAAGIPSALFWGTVMAVLSMIPNVGSALVWLPACIFLFIKGNTLAAVLAFLWCALIVGSADNVLRPILVGKDTEVPELLVLVSTLGGLATLGLTGFILGPVTALLFLTIWDIYGQTFRDVLPKND
jgi:predicted PurR-regulated permease PerM